MSQPKIRRKRLVFDKIELGNPTKSQSKQKKEKISKQKGTKNV